MSLPVFEQVFIDPEGREVVYVDCNQNRYSSLAQPRDIRIITGAAVNDERHYREEIAVSIRMSQGCPDVGVRKSLKWR